MLTQDFLPIAAKLLSEGDRMPVMSSGVIRTILDTQLESGGWWRVLDRSSDVIDKIAYRGSGVDGLNITTLDNGITSGCIELLARDGGDESIEAVGYCADRMLAVQRPNGGWPQHFTGPCDASDWPALGASYPEEWSRNPDNDANDEDKDQPYQHLFTLNDAVSVNAAKSMLTSYDLTHDERYSQSAIRTADFLLLAQMPDPQPGWCQQYDERMQPCWGRKYEPPAISARETQNSCLFLLDMYDRTGNRKYVRAAQDAVPWLKQSLRPDGKFAVFYELRTNSKLYITSNYQLAYDDSDWLRTYGRVVPSVVDAIEALLAEIAAGP